jgi:hypothetical protein
MCGWWRRWVETRDYLTLESGQMGASASDDRFSSQDEAGRSCPPLLCCMYIHLLQHMAMLVCTAQARCSVPCPCHPRLVIDAISPNKGLSPQGK